MNPIDPVNHLSCLILGLKTALFEAEQENRYLQKLLLSIYVKDAAKETNLYKMNRSGVKRNVIFQKEKQDLNLKIRELEAQLTDAESQNVNLNFQVRELKAFLEEKTNLLELYNPKNAKSEVLLLNNLKEKDLIQIIRNVLVCMKNGRASRTLQRSLKSLDQRRNRNLKKIKSEDIDGEMTDHEIDLMSTMIENQLKKDNFSFKCEKNESPGLQFSCENSEMPPLDMNESDITGAETNSSPDNAVDCISMEHSLFSPLSISDSDYSSNGVKSIESIHSEKGQSAESNCGTDVSLVEVGLEPSSEINIVMAEEDAKPSCETDLLKSDLDAEFRCETSTLPLESNLKPSCEIDVLPAEEDPKPSHETDVSPPQFDAERSVKINIVLAESDVESSCKISVSSEGDATPACETNVIPPELNAKSSCETNIRPAESPVKTNLLPITHVAKPDYESKILSAKLDTSHSMQETVANRAEASGEVILSEDLVNDPEEILDCIPFIDQEVANSAANLILAEMLSITFSSDIVKSFGQFCKNDTRSGSDQNSPACAQNADEYLTSEIAASNAATRLVPHDVDHESVPVKRKIDTSSQNDLKKIRLDEDVSNSSAEMTSFACVFDENTNADKIHPLEDETNQNLLQAEDDKTENIIRPSLLENIKIDPKSEHQRVSIPNNTINQDACESSEVLLHPENRGIVSSRHNESALDSNPFLETSAKESEEQSEIGTLESHLDKPIMSRLDFPVTKRLPVKSIFDVETDWSDCNSIADLKESTSASEDKDDSSVSIERKSDLEAVRVEVAAENTANQIEPKDSSQVENTEFVNKEETILNEVNPMRDVEKDLFYILNEFAALEKETRQRLRAFKEFLLKEDNHCGTEMPDETEFIVVAEISDNSDFRLSDRGDFIDDSSLPGNILNSLHKTSLKTVQLQTLEENLNICLGNRSPEETFIMPAFDSMAEVNDSSDDEKDALTIVEDDLVDDNPVADTAGSRSGVSYREGSNRESANEPEKRASYPLDAHSVSKADQPIKEITNIPRYNFRRAATAVTDSASETSRSSFLLSAKNSAHSPECSRESSASTAREPQKPLQMQYYVENQSSSPEPSLYVSVFDEVWSQIKLDWCENSSYVTSDTSDLMPCKSSIMRFVFTRKNLDIDSKTPNEEVGDLTWAKKSLEVYLKEKIRNHALALSTFSLTVRHSNKTTLCCALVEILLDSVTSNNARRNEIVWRDFLNLSTKLDGTIFPGFVDRLKEHLKTRMWVKDWKQKENGSLVNDLKLLSKFFTRLCKLNDDSSSVISLLRESLLSFKFRGHPIAFSVLNEWPEIFPRDARERNPIAHIIIFTLVNHKMDYNENLYNIAELQKLIHSLFDVKLGMRTAEEYAKELMLQLSDATWEDAIVLLCKRQMFPWTFSNVIMKFLVPILRKWKTEYFSEEILNKVLRALRTLLKACPYKKAENEMFKLDAIVNVLEEILSSSKGSCELKETVISVLCELSVYRFSTCVGILENWRPAGGVIRRSTFQLLRNHLPRYKFQWQDFLFPKKNPRRTRENKREGMDGFGGFHKGNSGPKNTHLISVGVTRKMNPNKPLPNRLLKDNPISNKRKKKKNSKKKGKPK